jgi:arabinan endo-1,5-alpha-L-arabinosidase
MILPPRALPLLFLGASLAASCTAAPDDVDAGPEPEVDASEPHDAGSERDARSPDPDTDGSVESDASVPRDGGSEDDAGLDAGPSEVCRTRITYGSAWIRGGDHPQRFDEVDGYVTWDGACVDDGSNSYATLSNGWKPYFEGHASCIMALDHTGCPDAADACRTRVAYGPAWNAPQNHPNFFDDVAGRITWDGSCHPAANDESYAVLSNGWKPHFGDPNACRFGFGYSQCSGLYENPVIAGGCADPGVLRVDDTFYVACTSGNAPSGFAIHTSSDLVKFTYANHIFPSGHKPSWAIGDFWAPELHRIGDKYVAYFTARHSDGKLSVGAAFADSPLGPYTDLGAPLVHDAGMGMIDANAFVDETGTPYLVWKADGNAAGQPTPIYGQGLTADGRSLTGSRVTLITNDLGWEGGVVEGPWVVRHGGRYYMFYSGNAFYNGTYAVGVARADAPLGPYTKKGDPIVRTNAQWVGPGHCSVIDGPHGEAQLVYHAWQAGHVNGPGDQRMMLVDPVHWDESWPTVPAAPSSRSRPLP